MDHLYNLEKFLKDYSCIDCKIRNLELEIEEFESTLITGVDTSRETISKTYKISSTVEDSTVRKEKLIKELNHLRFMKKKMDNVQSCLNEKEKTLLNIFMGISCNSGAAIKYNVTEQTICTWKRKLLIKISNLVYFKGSLKSS